MTKYMIPIILALGIASCGTPQGGYYSGGDPYYGAPPITSRSDPYNRHYSYRDDVYYNNCRDSVDPAGVIAGVLIGGLLGNALGRGDGGATIAGVVLGGAAGALLTRNLSCEDQSYAYRTYYDGLNSRRPNSRYSWNNPRTGHRGDFYVRDYYRGSGGHECANFSQTIWINGRPEEATGVACRQRDGTWAIVN